MTSTIFCQFFAFFKVKFVQILAFQVKNCQYFSFSGQYLSKFCCFGVKMIGPDQNVSIFWLFKVEMMVLQIKIGQNCSIIKH